MDDLETYDEANDGANPVAVKILAVTSPRIGGVNHSEERDLRNKVGKENREFAEKFTPDHHSSCCRLQDGMSKPE